MDYAVDKNVPVFIRNFINFCCCTNVAGKFPTTALVHHEDVPHPFDYAALALGRLDDDAFTDFFGEDLDPDLN